MRAMSMEPALAAFAVSLASLALLLSPPGRRILLDRPNERSLHRRPVPRSGGIAIALGTAAGLALAPAVPAAAFGLAAVLAVLSLLDDLRPLPPLLRLAGHLAAAAALVALEFGSAAAWLAPVLVLAIAWYANLYNFMDGADGLAGGMAVLGFGAYAWAAGLEGHHALSGSSAVVAAASLAFLAFNFHPARLFMGDVGSVPLGFLAGALGLLGWRDGVWPLWFPILVFAPFVGDATLTLLKRALRRERVWQAHKEHYYQRLARMGLGHRGTAGFEYAAMAACAGVALLARDAGSAMQAAAVGAVALGLGAIATWIDVRWRRHVRHERHARDARDVQDPGGSQA
jgi:UDP-N-acetylmuramyl pentapeptide phosphotransferase/UDP-N-acetylglucosamine-1-phosphate transferase